MMSPNGKLVNHPISVEVVFQLSGCNQDGIDQLLNLRVPSLGFIEHLADEVNRVLDFIYVVGFLTLTTMTMETTWSMPAM
jgi:hypothetical protein